MVGRLATAVVLLALALIPVPDAVAGGELRRLEAEFKAAIDKVTPATVACVAPGAHPRAPASSGVIVSRQGLVLSDADAGVTFTGEGKDRRPVWNDTLEVRVPDLRRGSFKPYTARVIHRDKASDSSLIQIDKPPALGFPDFLIPGRSGDLEVGSFTFAMGNAWDTTGEQPPSLTVGVLSSLRYLPGNDPGGRHAFLYVSAAVNPGMNGGPVVNVKGHLVGTISTWGRASDRTDPYQYLGKVVPIDRIRHAYATVEAAKNLFPDKPRRERSTRESDAMQVVLHAAAAAAHPSVVSIETVRKNSVSETQLVGRAAGVVPHYRGPFSGLLVDGEGWVVTGLYNLTNIAAVADPRARAILKPQDQVSAGLADVTSITVHLSGGGAVPAKLVAYHEGLALALLKADTNPNEAGSTSARFTTLVPSPAKDLAPGMFVLALGNPFGKDVNPDPLLTFGILSKRHPDDVSAPWRGQWQTDAPVTDANCGGAVVDVEGRLVGMLNLWTPSRHGRASGIGFVVPWETLAAALPGLKQGKSVRRPFLGVSWDSAERATFRTVVPDTPAAKAGLLAGDVILAVDGKITATVAEAAAALRSKWAGDEITLSIQRGEEIYDVKVVLGAMP